MSVDLENRLQRYGAVLDAAIESDRTSHAELSSDPPEDLVAVAAPSSRPRRRTLVAITAAGLLIGGCLSLLIERHPDTQEPTSNTAPDTSPVTTSASPPSVCTRCVSTADIAALELSTVPDGYALAGQVVRPAVGGDVQSAVFVRHDQHGNLIAKVVVRFGQLSLMGLNDGSPLGPNNQTVTPPINLTTARSGNMRIEQSSRTIHVQYDLGALGNLALETFHVDASTDLVMAQQMQQIAAALQLTKSSKIAVVGPLPDNWQLAAAGLEPTDSAETRFQAFEVDTPDGGNKIIVENTTINDPDFAYWKMDETLQPLAIRGHAGNISTHQYPPTDTNAPPPANPTEATTLIWEEAPGHWVTVRADDMTTRQLLALADQLTPADRPHWEPPSQLPSTTTTSVAP